MHGFIRALYFLPFLTTAAAMAWVWRWFYQPVPIGLINDVLSAYRPAAAALPALDRRRRCPRCWRPRSGRGLASRSSSSSRGCAPSRRPITRRRGSTASRDWTILRRITLPLLKPTIVFLVVFSSIGFLRIFDQVYNMTTDDPGGPLNATKPLVLMIYQTAFSSFEMGYAAAQTVVLFLVLLVVSLLQLRLLRDR